MKTTVSFYLELHILRKSDNLPPAYTDNHIRLLSTNIPYGKSRTDGKSTYKML